MSGFEADSSGSGYGPDIDFSDHCHETSDSIKFGETFDELSDYQLLKDSVP
jgi:hypothetical protein